MPQSAYLDAEPAPASGRSSSARTLRLNAEDRSASGARLEVLIHEVTERALLLESAFPLAGGEKLEVLVPGIGAMQARVVWNMGRFFACQFTEPMPAAAARVL